MTFLQICQKISQLSGLHGSMTDVISNKDLQNKISNSVNESWIQLQLLRKDWSFMIKRHAFTCQQGIEIYKASSSTEPEVGIEDLGTYIRDSFFLDHKPLSYVTSKNYPYIDNTVEAEPKWFTVDPRTNDLYLDLPDSAYVFDVYYRKSVQDLFSGSTPNNNIPELPEGYHSILVYGGLSSFAAFIGSPELYGEWTLEYEKILGSMMREFLPSKKINQRSII